MQDRTLLCENKPAEAIETAARRLEGLARKLRMQARPGHVAYVNKASAANEIESIITELLTNGRA